MEVELLEASIGGSDDFSVSFLPYPRVLAFPLFV